MGDLVIHDFRLLSQTTWRHSLQSFC